MSPLQALDLMMQGHVLAYTCGVPPSAGTPWTMFIGYGRPYETDRIFSLDGGAWSYSGGAHGNPDAASVLWNKAGHSQ